MPPRVPVVGYLLRNPSIFIFRSHPIRYAPLTHTRTLRTRPRDRWRPPIDVEGRSRPQEDEEEEDDIEEENEDLEEDEDEELDTEDKEFDEEEFQRFVTEQEEGQPATKKRRVKEGKKSKADETEGVNFYEQEEGKPETLRRKDQDDFAESLGEDEQAIDEDIEEIEEELDQLESDKPYIPPDFDEDELRKKYGITQKKIDQFGDAFIEQLKELQPGGIREGGQMPHRIRPKSELSTPSSLVLEKFNTALDKADLYGQDEKSQQALWLYYERSKMYIPGILQMLPEDAWTLLWKSSSRETPENPNRAKHLMILTDDMGSIGRSLTQEQRFARLEGLFWDGKQGEALKQWEDGLKKGDAGSAAYLEMGIRMYAYDRKLERAEELVDVLFKLHKANEPRILLQVISASIGTETDEGYKRAFRLYQLLRRVLTDDIHMEDFDHISSEFLRFGQNSYASAVFRDMMMVGEERHAQSRISNAFERLGKFMSTSKDPKEINMLGLDSLNYLPRKYQNKWFYATWMRTLISTGQNEPARQVMQLMFERGVKPDAKHATGLINGYLRTSSPAAQKQAEKMAWAMIQERLNLVVERRKQLHSSFDGPAKSILDTDFDAVPSSEGLPLRNKPIIPIFDKSTRVPPASIETFSLMIQHYLRRGLFDNVAHLRNLLVAAELPMNAFIMNHLLYAELRNGSNFDLWTRFKTMSQTVHPDIETWNCLWDCSSRHIGLGVNWEIGSFPRPRELFRAMREWFVGLRGQARRDALNDLELDGYNNIIQAFCYARDPAGSFAALAALREMFGVSPGQKTMRMLVMSISRLGLYTPRNYEQARAQTKSTAAKENLKYTTQVLEMITQFRAQGYKDDGYKVEKGNAIAGLSDEQLAEEQHRTALQLLYTVLKQVQQPKLTEESEEGDTDEAMDVDVAPLVQAAAKEIGYHVEDVEGSMGLV